MHQAITRALRSETKYCFESGPDKVRSWGDASAYGVNCGALVHLLTLDIFGIQLPQHLLPLELFHDRTHYEEISFRRDGNGIRWELGDIIFFGKTAVKERLATYEPQFDQNGLLIDWQAHPHLHVAFSTGCYQFSTDPYREVWPLFVHATNYRRFDKDRQNDIVLWSLRDFSCTVPYRQIYGIRKLIR